MAKIRAYIYKTTDPALPYKVFPPVVILGKGDKLEVVNTVEVFDAFLTVGDGVFEGGEIKKQKVAKEQIHHEGGRRCGTLPSLSTEVEVDGKKATGNFRSVIIIDP